MISSTNIVQIWPEELAGGFKLVDTLVFFFTMILAKKKQKANCSDKHKEIQYKRISGNKMAFRVFQNTSADVINRWITTPTEI